MTLTAYADPVTDAAALKKLTAYADRIAKAKKRVSDLEAQRDAEIVRITGTQYGGYGHLTAVARAAGLSRQRVDTIRRLARARREGLPPGPGWNDPKS